MLTVHHLLPRAHSDDQALIEQVQSVREFLTERIPETSSYTTMRIDRSGRVLEFDSHLQRLVDAHYQLNGKRVERSDLQRKILTLLQLKLRERSPPLRITAVLESNERLSMIAEPLWSHKVRNYGCQVEIRQAERSPHPARVLKHAKWPKERMSLEDEKLEESDEVLLAGHDGAIFEGLSSNFFTIERDPVLGQARVVTAPLESVLPGTIQKLVLDYCLARNIPIEFKHPLISDLEAGRWMGAFITSTSRLVLPIEEVVDRRNLAFNRSHTLAEEPLVKEIREAVANNVQ